MSGTFAILQRFFTFNLLVALSSALGATLLTAGLIVGSDKAAPILGFAGAVFLVVPLSWTGPVFRELMASRRLALVPALRRDAAIALLLLALAIAVVTEILVLRVIRFRWAAAAAAPGLVAFGLSSGFLLLGQWISTFRVGMLVQLLALFGMLSSPEWAPALLEVLLAGGRPVALAGAAALAWCWLFLAIAGARPLKGPSVSQQPFDIGDATSFWQTGWLPMRMDFGKPVQARRSLIRGGSDSFASRITTTLLWLLGMPTLYLMFGAVLGRLDQPPFSHHPDLLAMSTSIVSLLALSPITLADWPSRARWLWLRERGARNALWHSLERTLIDDALLVGGIALVVAAILRALFATAPGLLLVYIATSVLSMLCGAYMAFWCRARGEDLVGLSTVLAFIWGFGALLGWALYAAFGLPGAVVLFALLCGLTWICRRAARAQFLAIDWCAIRPLRRKPNGALVAEAH